MEALKINTVAKAYGIKIVQSLEEKCIQDFMKKH